MTGSGLRPAIIFSLAAFAVSRIVVQAAAVVAAYHGAAPQLIAQDPSALLAPWMHWDSTYHLEIAQHGYPVSQPKLLAFPPLPWTLDGLLASVLHISELAAAMLVSAVAEIVALVVLYRLAERDLGRLGARFAVVALLSFSSAFFLAAPYAEPFQLACLCGSFLAARNRRWTFAGILVALATLSKLWSIVAVVPLLVECWSSGVTRRRMIGASLAVVLPPVLAVAGFCAFAWRQFGDALLPISVERLWGKALAPPWVAVAQGVQAVVGRHLVLGLDLVALVLITAAAVYVFLGVRRSYGVLLGVSALALASTTELTSTNRFALAAFPLFIAVAHVALQRRAVLVVWCAAGVPLQLLLVSHFATGTWAG
ncbi:MAG: glycosyltransferase family 39 protein [Candidatus Dormibacteraeota bacterium]|nr:glycosyltransferase family 39 protein [Candidatus Dormibacteraeota bacterium]